MPLYDRIADLPLEIGAYTLEGRSRRHQRGVRAGDHHDPPRGRRPRGARRGRDLRPGPAALAAGPRARAPARGRLDVRLVLRPRRRARPVRRRAAEHARVPQLPPLGVRVGRARPRPAPGRDHARRGARPRPGADQLRRLAPARRAAERRPRHAPPRRLPGDALQARLVAVVGRRVRGRARARPARSPRSTSRAPTRARRSTRRPIPSSTAAAPRGSPTPGWRTRT